MLQLSSFRTPRKSQPPILREAGDILGNTQTAFLATASIRSPQVAATIFDLFPANSSHFDRSPLRSLRQIRYPPENQIPSAAEHSHVIVPTVFVFVFIVRVPCFVVSFRSHHSRSITIIGNTVNATLLDFRRLFLDCAFEHTKHWEKYF